VADLTRGAFIGRTLLTGATIASGGLATLSTSPTTPTVAKVATTFKNLNVLSPKAKAYRTFLKGVVGGAEMYQKHRPTGRLKTSVKTLLTKKHRDTSVGRNAFETAIKKPEAWHTKMEARQGVGNPRAYEIADEMRPNPEFKKKFMDRDHRQIEKHNAETRKLTARLTRGARLSHADELKAFRKSNPNSQQALAELKVRREFQAQDKHTANIQATKTTSTTSKGGGKSGGGGGKFGGNTFGRHSPWSLLRNDKNF